MSPDKTDDERTSADRAPVLTRVLTSVPQSPNTLVSTEAKSRWDELCCIMIRRGILSEDFLPSIEHYCRAFDRWEKIKQTISKDGGEIVYDKAGKPLRQHPLSKELTAITIFIRSCHADFGLTPASARASNISVSGGSKDSVRSRSPKSAAFED